MHANQQQRNMNRIYFEPRSNFLERHDNVPSEVALLGAFLIKLLNLAQKLVSSKYIQLSHTISIKLESIEHKVFAMIMIKL